MPQYASKKGFFIPKNKSKYVGNPDQIIWRSTWELKIMGILDGNPNVIYWSSEELVIPYYDPIRGCNRRYFPDFLVKIRTSTGEVKTAILEVKPDYQTNLRKPPPKRMSRKFISEAMDVATNHAKWEAATKFAKEQGWEFRVVTEKNFSF